MNIDMELAEVFFKEFNEELKINSMKQSIRLCIQVVHGVGLSDRYFIALDNDVLNAIQKPGDYKARYVALTFLLEYLRIDSRGFCIVITPAIFFEFFGN